MQVYVYYDNKLVTVQAALIEGRTWGRLADVLEGLGYKWEWKEEKPYKLYISQKQQSAMLGKQLNEVQLTKNFNLKEFMCPCCGCVKIDPELVIRLQMMRNELGKPIRISSGYRCKEHNKKVGGAGSSQHLKGTAADICSPGVPIGDIYNLSLKYFDDGGIGRYTAHNHVDTGPKRRWVG